MVSERITSGNRIDANCRARAIGSESDFTSDSFVNINRVANVNDDEDESESESENESESEDERLQTSTKTTTTNGRRTSERAVRASFKDDGSDSKRRSRAPS